jgi:hypothetical protein
MKKKALLILLISIIGFRNIAIGQFQIKVKTTNILDSIAYFRGVVFDDKNFIPKDTLELYKETNIIKNAKPIIGGIYYLYFPKSKQKIYLTIDNKDTLSISFSDSVYLNTIKTKSIKNDSFFAYQRLDKKLTGFDSLYEDQIKKGRKFNQAQKAAFFQPKNLQLSAARNSIMKTVKSESSLYLYFDGLNKLDNSIPNKKNYTGRFNFLKTIDINNPKLLFTANLKQIYSKYLSYYPLQADSIIKGVDTIMHKLDCKGKAYPYTFDYLLKLLKNRDIQNNTLAYTYFINKYVKENKCKFLDPKVEKQLLEELEKVNNLKLMDTSLNIILKDTAGIKQDLHEFAKQFNYTLITFFDPSCEHCKVELPKMDATITKIEKDLVLNIGKYVVCNDIINQTDLWKEFIKEHHLNQHYIHVNLEGNNDIRKVYDAFSNPLFYLINSDGKFVGKKLSPNTLQKIIIADIQSVKN